VIKLILIGVACFLLALAASTTLMVLRTPRKVPPDGVATADSVVRAAASPAPAPPADPAAASQGGQASTSAYASEAPAPVDLMQLAQAIPHTAEPAKPSRPEKPEPLPADYTRLAKILVNMKPTEAAAIMGYLADLQVEGVMRSLGPRQAATMLAALPTERAAKISKRLLVPPPPEKQP